MPVSNPAALSEMRSRASGIGAVIFDLDGTLIHSRIDFSEMKRNLISIYTEHGVPATILSMDYTLTTNMKNAREYLLEKGDINSVGKLEAQVESKLEEIELSTLLLIKPVENAREVVENLRSRGIGVGILTRGSRRYARLALKMTRLEPFIDHMMCRDDSPWWEAKPNGVALLRLVGKMGVRTQDCLVVGDHVMDMECALNTGALFVGVLTGSFDEISWKEAGCENVIKSVSELPGFIMEKGLWGNRYS